jgi:hypothetical protein
VVARGVEEDGTTLFLIRVVYGLFLRCDCRGVKLLLAGHGGEGRMRLDVTSVVTTYCSGILDWRYCFVFPISYLPDVLEKDLSSHPSGWALLRCSKPIVAIVAALTWCLKMSYFWVRYLYLVGDDEDDGLDGALELRCEVILAKVWDHIVFSFFVESFVIGFAIIEIPSVVISKNGNYSLINLLITPNYSGN